jgi:hypothetical protein
MRDYTSKPAVKSTGQAHQSTENGDETATLRAQLAELQAKMNDWIDGNAATATECPIDLSHFDGNAMVTTMTTSETPAYDEAPEGLAIITSPRTNGRRLVATRTWRAGEIVPVPAIGVIKTLTQWYDDIDEGHTTNYAFLIDASVRRLRQPHYDSDDGEDNRQRRRPTNNDDIIVLDQGTPELSNYTRFVEHHGPTQPPNARFITWDGNVHLEFVADVPPNATVLVSYNLDYEYTTNFVDILDDETKHDDFDDEEREPHAMPAAEDNQTSNAMTPEQGPENAPHSLIVTESAIKLKSN